MEEKIAKLSISGMSCEDCARTIEKAVKQIDGVIDLKVDYRSSSALLRYDEKRISPEQIVALSIFRSPSQYKARVDRMD
jgi:copper chaperone CopZ